MVHNNPQNNVSEDNATNIGMDEIKSNPILSQSKKEKEESVIAISTDILSNPSLSGPDQFDDEGNIT